MYNEVCHIISSEAQSSNARLFDMLRASVRAHLRARKDLQGLLDMLCRLLSPVHCNAAITPAALQGMNELLYCQSCIVFTLKFFSVTAISISHHWDR